MQTTDLSTATETTIATRPSELDRALTKIRQILLDGLRHGFFEFSVSGETIQRDKRRLLIKAGNSHAFVICSEEFEARKQ